MLRSRLSLVAVALATSASIAGIASAADVGAAPDPSNAVDYDARIGVVFIPLEDVDLIPSSECPVSQSGQDNAALNCLSGLMEATTYTVTADEALVTAFSDALAPYNVQVVTERPADYVPYSMIVVTADESAEATSRTCAGAPIDCDGPNRNEIAITSGGTMNCMDPDVLQTVLIAFGYMSGLENNDNPLDPMFYPPDFTMPSAAFDDSCSTVVPTLDEMGDPNNLVCPGLYHEAYCMDTEDQMNSHQELLGVYGERPADPDTTPPTIDSFTTPEDGGTLPAGADLELDAMVSDDSNVVAVRWVVASDALLGAGTAVDGQISICTNGVCDDEWEGNPFKNPDTPWPFVLQGLPGGEYTATLEVSDLSGNAADPMMVSFTIEGGSAEDTGPDPDTGEDDNADDDNADDDDNGDDDDDGDTEDESDDDGGSNVTGDGGGDEGCSCTTSGNPSNAAFLLFGIAGLAMTRRRKSA